MRPGGSICFILLAMFGAVALLASRAGAGPRHCRKDCKQQVADCVALGPPNSEGAGAGAETRTCRKLHKTERKACHHLVKLCKEENPTTIGVCISTTTSTTLPGTGCGPFVAAWGTSGTGDGESDRPVGGAGG